MHFAFRASHDYYGFDMPLTMLFDVKNKIAMDWSPRAACARAVQMFFAHMDLVQGRDWQQAGPHEFRNEFHQRCGYSHAGMLKDRSWYRFKMVRNPYERLVSSYLHIMRNPKLYSLHISSASRSMLSFEGFVALLEKEVRLDPSALYGNRFAGGQARFQHHKFEIAAYEGRVPPPFHAIIQIENSQAKIEELNAAVAGRGLPFVLLRAYDKGKLSNATATHLSAPSNASTVSQVSYPALLKLMPVSYRRFYSDSLQQRVAALYAWDLKLYNYQFEFNEAANSSMAIA